MKNSPVAGQRAEESGVNLGPDPARATGPSRSLGGSSTSPRVCLFTDTLADVNGVSRFIRNVAAQGVTRGLGLDIITSTRLECPVAPNIHNVPPLYARPMPGYPQLELALPYRRRLLGLARHLSPDVVHVSTPGPVGTAGRWVARTLGLPLVGTYHTDFPAYIDHLFDDAAFTWACTQSMKWFYRPFARVFTRSVDYGHALRRLGVPGERIVRLLPGIATDVFDTRFHDPTNRVWEGVAGVRAGSVKVLYVGRVSVEKNLSLLAHVWPLARRACVAAGVDVQLVVIGDGPYRVPMGEALGGEAGGVVFAGFRHGVELSRLYASSDLFLFPSLTDTLGQVVMEAQSAGLPVIVADKGGPSEVVDDGLTGFVVRTEPARGEAARWAGRIVELATNRELRRQMGAAGHEKIRGLTIERSFEHFWSVHVEVAREGAVSHRKTGPSLVPA